MAYVKWNCHELGKCSEELREAASRMSGLLDDLSETGRRLDPQLADNGELRRALRAVQNAATDDCDRLRRECSALEETADIYGAAERETLRRSESLPASIAERSLIFESWFLSIT
jgi:hypothetical protein